MQIINRDIRYAFAVFNKIYDHGNITTTWYCLNYSTIAVVSL